MCTIVVVFCVSEVNCGGSRESFSLQVPKSETIKFSDILV